jgi:hypothetical protein
MWLFFIFIDKCLVKAFSNIEALTEHLIFNSILARL